MTPRPSDRGRRGSKHERGDERMPKHERGDERMPKHGMGRMRGMDSVPRGRKNAEGRFGRMFPFLEAYAPPDAFLIDIGMKRGPMDEGESTAEIGDSDSPAGVVFLGQFIDHDITLDETPLSEQQQDPTAMRNERIPHLDLDSVYGLGPDVAPFMYEFDDRDRPTGKMSIGTNEAGEPNDLPRSDANVALIGDPRNDENVLISQLHLAFLKFHNRVVDHLQDAGVRGNLFERARQVVQWHYQWIVLNEFLPAICDEKVLDEVRRERDFYTFTRREGPFMPVEFAGAAYRFGHSQVRASFEVNGDAALRIFGENGLGKGFSPVRPEHVVDWSRFFPIDDKQPQAARKIDRRLAGALFELPFVTDPKPEHASLATRNLLRGKRLGLPSGQAVARAIGAEVLSNEELGLAELIEDHGLPSDTEAPLWYYVLAEADVQNDGERLGEVGSRLVAEVLIGLVETDPSSYLSRNARWDPSKPVSGRVATLGGSDREFTMADLLRFTADP